MPRKTLEVSVNPKVMKWARESVGLSVEEAAKRAKTTVEIVHKWESGSKKPSLRVLKELTVFYKRPLAVFFLPEPPKEPPPPKDFRVLPRTARSSLSKNTLLALRRARRLQSLAAELSEALESEVATGITETTPHENPEQVAAREREHLGISIEEQLKWRDSYAAFRAWRRAVERKNILVFQMNMPVEEVRGFSLLEHGLPPIIVVSAPDSINARIFTLFHEYAHIILNAAGICIPDEGLSVSRRNLGDVETFSDHFAGALLVPMNVLQSIDMRHLRIDDPTLDAIAKRFKVSRYVILRRMQIADLISREQYWKKVEEWKSQEKAKERREKRFYPHMSQAKRCLQEKGPIFASLVMEAKTEGIITLSDVADYLSVRVNNLHEVESLLGE